MTKEELKKEAQEQVNYCTPLYPESFIQGYIAGAEPRENKIADIKANCDLAIEGRDLKIKELERENAEQKEKYSDNLSLKDEELMCLETEFNTYKSEAKELIKKYMLFCKGELTHYKDIEEQAEQFLQEIEK